MRRCEQLADQSMRGAATANPAGKWKFLQRANFIPIIPASYTRSCIISMKFSIETSRVLLRVVLFNAAKIAYTLCSLGREAHSRGASWKIVIETTTKETAVSGGTGRIIGETRRPHQVARGVRILAGKIKFPLVPRHVASFPMSPSTYDSPLKKV